MNQGKSALINTRQLLHEGLLSINLTEDTQINYVRYARLDFKGMLILNIFIWDILSDKVANNKQ